MTCVIGYIDKENNKVFMGGDSAGITPETLGVESRADTKVFKNGDFIFGFTDSFRMGQLLRYSLKVPRPRPSDEQDMFKFMCTSFISEVRDCFAEGGYTRSEEGAEVGGLFLVGYKGQLFIIYDDFQVGIPMDGYSAVGCGADIAKGAISAIKAINFSNPPQPQDVIMIALTASEKHNAGVRSPFLIIDEDEKVYQLTPPTPPQEEVAK